MWISLGMGSLGNTWFLLLVYMIWWIPLWLAWCFSFLPLTHSSVILDCHVLCFLSNGIIGGFWNVYNNYGEKGWWMNWSVPGWKGKFVIVTPPPPLQICYPTVLPYADRLNFVGPRGTHPAACILFIPTPLFVSTRQGKTVFSCHPFLPPHFFPPNQTRCYRY